MLVVGQAREYDRARPSGARRDSEMLVLSDGRAFRRLLLNIKQPRARRLRITNSRYNNFLR